MRHRILSRRCILILFSLFSAQLSAILATAQAEDASANRSSDLTHIWPPVVGSEYPDLELFNHAGTMVKLSSYRGSVILLEPMGMGCPACQAFAGAQQRGVYGQGRAQPGLPSAHEMLKKYAKVNPTNKRLVYVQLLLYDMSNRNAPKLEDARAWAKHFKLDKQDNALVLLGDARYINGASYNMIPGFQLIDKNFVLRADATGHHPKDDLYNKLMPMIKKLLQEKPKLADRGQGAHTAAKIETTEKPRTWSSGKFVTQATLVAVGEGKVTLRKTNGKLVVVAIDVLRNEDQEYVKKSAMWAKSKSVGDVADE